MMIAKLRSTLVPRLWAVLGGALAGQLLVVAACAQQSVPHPDLIVDKPVANMFSKPDAGSDVVSQTLYGSGVLTIEKKPGWYRIVTADDYSGWVAAPDVRPVPREGYAPAGQLLRVSALSANIYREPDVTRHAPLLELPWESRLELAPDKPHDGPRWLPVRLVDGELGWVQRGDVSEDSGPMSVEATLQLAHRFLGITYTWGGTSSYGFDCSGFTQMLVRQRGITMPRDADIQASWSGVVPVERKDLQPGDLLFFGSSPAKITHTGMYLGNGEFIHDTTHDHPGVQIGRLDDAPWTTLLVAERRIK
jgi:gamma-D-glutamyl-L-lysine dipeptidyl-peptidase